MTLVSTDELALECGLSAATIRRYARQGALPAVVSPGGHRRFDRDNALAALEALRDRIRHQPIDDEILGALAVPMTPRGDVITVIAEGVVRSEPRSLLPIMTRAEWDQLEAVIDERY